MLYKALRQNGPYHMYRQGDYYYNYVVCMTLVHVCNVHVCTLRSMHMFRIYKLLHKFYNYFQSLCVHVRTYVRTMVLVVLD